MEFVQKTFNDKKEKEGDSQQLQYKLVMVAVLLDVDIAVLCPATSQSLLSHPSDFPSTADPTSFPTLTSPMSMEQLRQHSLAPASLVSTTSSVTLSPHENLEQYHQSAPSLVSSLAPSSVSSTALNTTRLAPVLPRPPSTALT